MFANTESDILDNDNCPEKTTKNTKRKKGVRQPENYKINKVKTARVKGLEYINWRNKVVPAITCGSDKDCKCRLQCYSKIPVDERKLIFERFRGMNSKNEQDSYLIRLIVPTSVKQRRRRKPAGESGKPPRESSFIYEIEIASEKIKVCKQAFINLHGVNGTRVRRLCKLATNGETTPVDRRGQGKSANAKPDYVIDMIKEHISAYLVNELIFLSEKVDITAMHKLFKSKFPDANVSYSFYRKICKEDFSL